MSLDVMKQALEALQEVVYWYQCRDKNDNPMPVRYQNPEIKKSIEAITFLRDALEQVQEPVAWQVMVEDEAMKEFPIKDMAHDWCAKKKLSGSPSAYWIRPLYTAPRQWQGLTDEEIWSDGSTMDLSEDGIRKFARAIEAKLREKNA